MSFTSKLDRGSEAAMLTAQTPRDGFMKVLIRLGSWSFQGLPQGNLPPCEFYHWPAGFELTVLLSRHALDVFLDIDHQLSKARLPLPSPENRRADHTFMIRMRKYMPGKHQEFLLHLASHHRPIRELARHNDALRQPYDSVVLALKRFRDQHMRIACLYIVSMSRSAAALKSGCPVGAMMETMEREGTVRRPVRGTGGNELSCLLKATRDATCRAVLEGNIN